MAVEHVGYGDSLRQGTDKINAVLDHVDQQTAAAVSTANDAKQIANDAKQTAEQALDNSEATQHQLDTIVIDGDSSVEAAQARVSTPKGKTFDVLKDRLDESEQDLITHKAETEPRLARVRNTSSQSIPASTVVALSFNSVRFDTDDMFDAGAGTRLTCNTPGKYIIIGQATFNDEGNISGSRSISIRLNGSTVISENNTTPTGSTTRVSTATLYALSQGDYVELCVYQSSGVALNVEQRLDFSPAFSAVRVG